MKAPGAGAWCAVLFTPCIAHAQAIPDAGTILRQNELPPLTLPRKPASELKLETPAPPPAASTSDVRVPVQRFRITGTSAFDEADLVALVKQYAGRELSLGELEQAAASITRHYRAHGYPLARAYLPSQDIEDGVVEIAVIEGRLDEVRIDNRSRVRAAVIADHLEPLRGRIVRLDALERKLLLIHDLAGVSPGSSSFTAGARAGDTDLLLQLGPAPLLSASVGFDNFGSRYTGYNRVTVQVHAASLAGVGDRLSLEAARAHAGLETARVAYQLPLGRDGFRLGAAYSQLHYRLGRDFKALEANGEASTATVSGAYPLLRSREANLAVQVSFDYRRFRDRLDVAGTLGEKHTRTATASWLADARDSLFGLNGASFLTAAFVVGRVVLETPEVRAADVLTARTNGDYRKATLTGLRLQRLTARTSLIASFSGQYAADNLDSSEKFILGGPAGVRAYPQGEAAGDSGYVASAELRYDVPSPLVRGALQSSVFVETGGATLNRSPFTSTDNHRRLSGAGVAVTWARTEDFQLRLMVATRIGNAQALSDRNARTRAWVHAVKHI